MIKGKGRRATATVIAFATGCGLAAVGGSAAAASPPASVRTTVTSAQKQVDAAAFADRMVRAWGAGDHSATRYYATHAVTRKLFAQADPGGAHWRRTAVHGAAGTAYVTYHDDALGGTLVVAVGNVGLHDGNPAHSVYSVRFHHEPRTVSAVQWADLLVRAWGAGHRGDAAYYATQNVANTMFHHANPGGAHWVRTGAQGAAGTIYVTYRDTTTGGHLTVGVSDVELAQGAAHAAYRVHFW